MNYPTPQSPLSVNFGGLTITNFNHRISKSYRLNIPKKEPTEILNPFFYKGIENTIVNRPLKEMIYIPSRSLNVSLVRYIGTNPAKSQITTLNRKNRPYKLKIPCPRDKRQNFNNLRK